MNGLIPSDESEANLLERKWFAAGRSAAETQSECDALAYLLASTQSAWRQARARLTRLEALRDALGEELAAVDDREPARAPPLNRSERSAA